MRLNIRPDGGMAKAYQVRQFLTLVETYGLSLEDQAVSDYTIVVFYSEEDGSYIADIPGLKSCSAWGPTPDAAVREVLVAKDAYLESLRAHGDPVPEPR